MSIARVSWVDSANDSHTDFPLANLPLGIFSAEHRSPRPGVAIGGAILDLVAVAEQARVPDELAALIADCTDAQSLNPLLAAGRDSISALRSEIGDLLDRESVRGKEASAERNALLVTASEAELYVPAKVANYTDFYASIHHATNVGSMFRPDNPLLPNYKWVPIGYHGRASSIVATGTPVRRPHGQTNVNNESAPVFGPTKRLDYELEIGAFIAGGTQIGETISIDEAERYIGGLCLVNDWSARDVQAWEYQPLGPFLAKSFATSVSPWIVTLDALAPFRTRAFERDAGDPQPLPYLSSVIDRNSGGFDITLEVLLVTADMRSRSIAPYRVSIGSFTSMYWTIAQMLTHHASNGCSMVPGDLLASGTVSGTTNVSRGCLLERTWRGSEPLVLPTGEQRKFLEDDDEIIMRGWCERDGYTRIGFGDCRGIVTPA